MKSFIFLFSCCLLVMAGLLNPIPSQAAMRPASQQQQLSSNMDYSLYKNGASQLKKRKATKSTSRLEKHASIAKGFTALSYPLLILSPMLIGAGLAPFMLFAVLGAIASLIAFGFGYSTWKQLKAGKQKRPKLKRIARFAMLTPFLGFLLIVGLTFLNFSSGTF